MRQWTIDAFADRPFKGNAACVVEPFEDWPDAAWMQALAAENNVSETAFLKRTGDPARFGLRWFTPTTEVPLCGHATLAAAHAVMAELGAGDRLTFETLSGSLAVVRQSGGYEMDFPNQAPRRTEVLPEHTAVFGATPIEAWVSNFFILVFADEATVRRLAPETAAVATLGPDAGEGAGQVGVLALADAGRPYDAVSRFFAPGCGIPEDPTTGSLHCLLAPLVADKLGRSTVTFHQAYPGRGGDLECEVRGDRVAIRGRAITIQESVLRIRP
jgi:predicted PhzF superfamily epimerase YddE/YHI9